MKKKQRIRINRFKEIKKLKINKLNAKISENKEIEEQKFK
jgi:hypothetical protein